jgi:enamine deaminase RidA (YjgF/YER057c/UK114 family)
MAEIVHVKPDGIFDSSTMGFSQVVTATEGTTVYISGQVSCDERGRPVGVDDLEAQTEQAMKNLSAALAAVGATFSDVVKLVTYVVDYDPSMRDEIGKARDSYLDGESLPASTLVGVKALAAPMFLIEIEAVAVI